MIKKKILLIDGIKLSLEMGNSRGSGAFSHAKSELFSYLEGDQN